MNPVLLFTVFSFNKKQIYFVMATLVVILALPVMAVFALGQSALSVLTLGIGSSESDGLYQGPVSTTDTYAWGNCTYWASLLRQQANKPIPNTWGNANTWAIQAYLGGYQVDHTPSVTAIMQTSAGKEGHVAYVTAVDASTGAWTISEMNVKGLDIVDTATLSATSAANFSFIHDRVTPNGL
jgi:surface antigen